MADFKPSQVTGDLSITQEPVKVLATAQTSVPVSTQLTVVTFTATASDKNIMRITGASEFGGQYQLFLDTVLQDEAYSAGGGGLNVIFQFDNWELGVGQVVDVKVEHGSDASRVFSSSIWGF